MKRIFFAFILFACGMPLLAQTKLNYHDYRGEILQATNINGSPTLSPALEHSTHWYALSEFLIEKRDGDSPRRFIFSGKIKDRNAGAPTEQLPIFFGSDLHAPRLAAVTDSQGHFSFNVTLKEDARSGEIQCSAITNGAVYIANANVFLSDSFDDKRYLKSGLVRKYSLAELIKLSENTNNVAGGR